MFAQDINPWKHCGIGATIFDDNETAAAISNIIWDLGTTAVTSNTVSQDTCDSKMITSVQFLQDNFEQLSAELATGEGASVDAFIALTGADVNNLRSALLVSLDDSRQAQVEALYFASVK